MGARAEELILKVMLCRISQGNSNPHHSLCGHITFDA